jgi:hypothetical protein
VATIVRAVPPLLRLVASGCSSKTTPTEPAARSYLVLSYSGPCLWSDVAVSVDGMALGRVRIPGAISLPVDPGAHRLQVGTSPEVPIDMPADRDLLLTNVPSACP